MSNLFTIEKLGSGGDGVAQTGHGPVFVPYAAPGDVVKLDPPELVALGPNRTAPRCVHFTRCGGCVLQHIRDNDYRGWKRDLVVQALAHRGLPDIPVADAWVAPPASRRRANFKAMRLSKKVVIGFHARGSHDLFDLVECPVLRKEIAAALPALRRLLAEVLRPAESADVAVAMTDAGLDVAIAGKGKLDLARRQALAAFPAAARIAWSGEVVAERAPATVSLAGVSVRLPAGGFLQATAESEAELQRLSAAAVGGAKSVADLFAGCGTLTFALARTARVTAVEGDEAALAALDRAARHAAGLKPITPLRRDLFRDPLMADELNAFDAVLFDPPFAGAKAQAEQIAASRVKRVVGISCNPATFARDARILVDGGYRLVQVWPVDQFLWSAHVELVARFER